MVAFSGDLWPRQDAADTVIPLKGKELINSSSVNFVSTGNHCFWIFVLVPCWSNQLSRHSRLNVSSLSSRFVKVLINGIF